MFPALKSSEYDDYGKLFIAISPTSLTPVFFFFIINFFFYFYVHLVFILNYGCLQRGEWVV